MKRLEIAAKTRCAAAAFLAAAASACASPADDRGAADRAFFPLVAPKQPAKAELSILPRKNMAFVKAALDGRECTLLFDTGATHTTFDIGFVKRELPGVKLGEVMLAGETNVGGVPKIFRAKSLKIGEAEFRGFHAMALDISQLGPRIGTNVEGIVGMNIIGRVPALVSFGGRKVVFSPGPEDLAWFSGGRGAARIAEDPFSVALNASYGGRTFPVIVDSASTFTFLGKSTGWPSTGEAAGIGAVDVNGGASIAAEKGCKGILQLGEKKSGLGALMLGENVEISPLLVASPMNRIGADTLLSYDMLVDSAGVVRFRRRR